MYPSAVDLTRPLKLPRLLYSLERERLIVWKAPLMQTVRSSPRVYRVLSLSSKSRLFTEECKGISKLKCCNFRPGSICTLQLSRSPDGGDGKEPSLNHKEAMLSPDLQGREQMAGKLRKGKKARFWPLLRALAIWAETANSDTNWSVKGEAGVGTPQV